MEKSNGNVLFLTYDGLTDQLGQSQILPYYCSLSNNGWNISIVSLEKTEIYKNGQHVIQELCDQHKIKWRFSIFRHRIKFLSTILNLISIYLKGRKLINEDSIDLIHCRSFLTCLVGYYLGRKFKIPYIFDMRGFWIEERVEGGIWSQNGVLNRFAFHRLKIIELKLLRNAGHIVCLTNRAKEVVNNWVKNKSHGDNISVIPCCVDDDLFNPTKVSLEDRIAVRDKLEIKQSDFVLSYLGSIGTWYMLDEMLLLFNELNKVFPNSKFVIYSNESKFRVFQIVDSLKISRDLIRIVNIKRVEVPLHLSISDFSIFFIKPLFSKIGSSPTKLAELLCMNIPIVFNSGIGDLDEHYNELSFGCKVNNFSQEAIENAARDILKFPKNSDNRLNEYSRLKFSLEYGVNVYNKIYSNMIIK